MMRFNKFNFIISTLILVIFCDSLLLAQSDFSRASENSFSNLDIPPSSDNPPSINEFNNFQTAEEDFENRLRESVQKKIKEQKFKDLKEKGILNTQEIHNKRFESESKGFSKKNYAKIDKNLGAFVTDGQSITIICRDFGAEDGDIVTIYINDIPVIHHIKLINSFQQFTLHLGEGLNEISFEAENQGYSGPNTAAFVLFDDKGNVLSSNEWNLATGARAFLTIVKE